MNEVCVSKDALAAEGPAPVAGDHVEWQAAGTVARVEGDKFYITEETANGVPLPDDAPKGSGDDDIRDMAAAADREEGHL